MTVSAPMQNRSTPKERVWGRRVANARALHGLSQKQLAKVCEVSPSVIATIEAQVESDAPQDVLDRIAYALDCDRRTFLVDESAESVMNPRHIRLRQKILNCILDGTITVATCDLANELHERFFREEELETIHDVLMQLMQDGHVILRPTGRFERWALTPDEHERAYQHREKEEIRLMEQVVEDEGQRALVMKQMSRCLDAFENALREEDIDGALHQELEFHLCWAAGCQLAQINFNDTLKVARVFVFSLMLEQADSEAKLEIIRQLFQDEKEIYETLKKNSDNTDRQKEVLEKLIRAHVEKTKDFGLRDRNERVSNRGHGTTAETKAAENPGASSPDGEVDEKRVDFEEDLCRHGRMNGTTEGHDSSQQRLDELLEGENRQDYVPGTAFWDIIGKRLPNALAPDSVEDRYPCRELADIDEAVAEWVLDGDRDRFVTVFMRSYNLLEKRHPADRVWLQRAEDARMAVSRVRAPVERKAIDEQWKTAVQRLKSQNRQGPGHEK